MLFKYSIFIVTLRILYASKSPVYVGADCKSAKIKSVDAHQSHIFGNELDDGTVIHLPLLSGANPAPDADAKTNALPEPIGTACINTCGAGLKVKVYVLRPLLLAPIALGTLVALAFFVFALLIAYAVLCWSFILYIDLDII